jgi:hypothetical protein
MEKMKKIESHFNPPEVLPSELVISSAGTHFYGIGLSHFGSGSQIRDRFHNPIFVALINTMLLIAVVFKLFSLEAQYVVLSGPTSIEPNVKNCRLRDQ